MLASALLAFGFFGKPAIPVPPTYSFNVLQAFPHDPAAFTQGLFFEPGGTLIESTGLYGASSIRRVDIETGEVLQSERLPQEWFGEGLTVVNGDTCVQLLWREGLVLVRDPESFELLRTLPLPRGIREGWGATTDGEGLMYVSDGTSTLHVLSTETLEVLRTVKVRAGGRELWHINELQWVRGEVWANILYDDRLAAIDPQSGEVRCFVDLEPILTADERRRCHPEAVLNGMAYDAERDRFFVTGKLWPKLYEIEVLAPEGPGGGSLAQLVAMDMDLLPLEEMGAMGLEEMGLVELPMEEVLMAEMPMEGVLMDEPPLGDGPIDGMLMEEMPLEPAPMADEPPIAQSLELSSDDAAIDVQSLVLPSEDADELEQAAAASAARGKDGGESDSQWV